jgi:cytochrome P450
MPVAAPAPISNAAEVLLGEAPPSPAGPVGGEEASITMPPAFSLPRIAQTMRFTIRQIEFVFRARKELGEVFQLRGIVDEEPAVVTSHPDHVRSLFTAEPALAPSLTGESPLRPIVGPNSVLTLTGPEHMRQRKLLLPPFHGEAIARYTRMINQAAEREIDRWPLNEAFPLAPAMQAITLDVIMSGVFGIAGAPRAGTPEHRLRQAIRRAAAISTHKAAQLLELVNIGHSEPTGLLRRIVAGLDRQVYAIIAARRRAEDAGEREDILSLLMSARHDDGSAMSDGELRDELLTLVLAGHETTANTLAWAFERLLRTPHAYARLREEARGTERDGDGAYVEATIHEAMRARPVIPLIGRRVQAPWQLGEWCIPAGTSTLISILLVHHRPDVYPDPYAFRPERFIGVKPGTYTWIPFGGGIRRCLGATLALAEARAVLRAVVRRTDMAAANPASEHVRHRNVTMIPAEGARVVMRSRTAANW